MDITYIKELQDSINNSNNEFIQEEYVLDQAQAAAKQALYYAHGNTEKNEINYRTAKTEEEKALSLNNKSVKAVNLATNAVTAAKQSLVDSGKATSNISTAAANMQIAANAITKLSSDVAGILAIANAADHGSQIQESVERSHKKIRKAAKMAEEVSLVSLQATIEAAQSTASTVVTDADLTQSSVTDLQKATAADYSTASQKSVSTNEALTEALKNEKASSGVYDISTKQDEAIMTSRALINHVSNDNLVVFDMAAQQNLKAAKQNKEYKLFPIDVAQGESFTIQFKKFHHEDLIQNYNLVMVKYTEAHTFDINVAKDLSPGTYRQFAPQGYKGYSSTFYLLGTEQALIPFNPNAIQPDEPANANEYWQQNMPGIAVDYHGKPIEQGTYYVAFVYAEYTDEYERELGVTDGYLSIMSEKMILQTPLHKVPKHIEQKNGKDLKNLVINEAYFDSRNLGVQFEVYQKDYNPSLMEYRIILVEKQNVEADRINREIAVAINALDSAEYNYNVQTQTLDEMVDGLNLLEIQFNTLQSTNESLETQLTTLLEANPSGNKGEKIAPSVVKQQSTLETQISLTQTKLNSNRTQQATLETQIYGDDPTKLGGQTEVVATAKKVYKAAEAYEEIVSAKRISDFIFDEDLMSSVQPANYYTAQPFPWDEEAAKMQHTEAKKQLKLARTKAEDAIKRYKSYKGELADAKTAVSAAQEKAVFAKTALNVAEANLDKVELAELVKSSDVKKSSGSEVKISDFDKAVTKVKEARVKLRIANDELSHAEVELDRIENLGDIGDGLIQSLLSNYVKAVYENDQANAILELAKDNKQSDKKTEKKIKLGTEKVLFYTQVGEDATDNYGEPLQFNDASLWEYAIDDLTEKLQKSNDDDAAIDAYLENLNKQTLQDVVKEQPIAYQAVVLTAMADTVDGVENANQYLVQASEYSDPVSLIGPVD